MSYADHLLNTVSSFEPSEKREELEMFLFNAVAQAVQASLNEEQVQEHDRVKQESGPDAAIEYLRSQIPDYDQKLISAIDNAVETFKGNQ